MPPHHHLSDASVCHRWDNRRAPIIEVEPDCRLTLRLRDERSCKDIAQELDITLRQVRRYLARGYERLRATLEN